MSHAVDTALKAKIVTATNFSTHAPGGCHNTVRAQGSSFPVCVFRLAASLDRQSYSDAGVEWLDYDVKVIAPDNLQANVGTLLEAIHDVVERGALTITGYTHLQTLRVRRLPTYSEDVGGASYVHRGHTYRVWVVEA